MRKLRCALAAGLGLATMNVAAAADLGGFRGSVKDDNYAPMPRVSLVDHCYVRIDTGYGWSGDPDARFYSELTGTDRVRHMDYDDGAFVEGGVGCSTGGPRAWRAEQMLGHHFRKDYIGEPPLWTPPNPGGPIDDPLHTSIRSTTLMINVYKDLGTYNGFTPYVGAGIGAAYNQMDEVYFTQNPFLTNRIFGDNNISLAWSLMAGFGYDLSTNATLDIGYRYLDVGRIASQNGDTAGFWNPKARFDDLDSHEIKVGLRYKL
jgi:opacity protein-like surface antigen